MLLNVGDKAPSFILPSDCNKLVSSRDFLGRKIILFFYPKNNTFFCTRQACSLRNNFSSISTYNVEIIGISKDSIKSHQQFKQKYSLPYTLLSDSTGQVCKNYGVINKRSLFKQSFLAIRRTTFLINEAGIILSIWQKINIKNHAEEILKALATFN